MTDIRYLPAATVENYDWQLDGACRGADAALFFHPEGERGAKRVRRDEAAKAVCAGCPVLERCRDYALSTREPYGVWGGMSETDREAVLGPLT